MKSVLLLVATFGIHGCGWERVPHRMDQTNDRVGETNGQIDETNTGLGQVGEKLDKTNEDLSSTTADVEVMKEQLAKVGTAVDETQSSVAGMSTAMQETNAGIARTNSAIHSQILMLAIQEMLKPANTVVLEPPTAMIPAGKAFATEASSEEALGLAHIWLVDIRNETFDRGVLAAEGYPEADLSRMQAEAAHAKKAKLAALQVVSGYLPQSTVEELARQVVEHGRYDEDALAMLTMRASFITMYVLESGLFAERLTGYGRMLEAVKEAENVDYLGRLPFASRLKLKTPGVDEVSFDAPSTLLSLYEEIDKRFTDDLDLATPQSPELTALHDQVKAKLAYWREAK